VVLSTPGDGGAKRRRLAWPLAIAVVLAALGGAVAYVARRPATKEASDRPRSATPRPTAGRVSAAPSATGALTISSSVEGALVSVDGTALGAAPRTVELGAGPHRVRVEKPGFTSLERELHVVPGHTTRFAARLEREPLRLRVDADVPGASVFVDRRFLGTTPVDVRDVAPGPHRLNVSAEGYEMYAETIDLAASREVMVRFKEVRLDETIEVTHRHGVGSCRGHLRATTAGLAYEPATGGDAFSLPFASLEPLQVDYMKKNLRVKVRGGRTYNFTADGADDLLGFQRSVERARQRL
jgi:hypothetical protein